MNFTDLHERLRLELLRRIDADTLTGSRLAQQTGFRQAHISNFLNRRRALSLEGLDRVLAAQSLSIDQILPAAIVNLEAASSNQETLAEPVPLVPFAAAMDDSVIRAETVIEEVPVSSALLYENRPRSSPARARWRRFVAIRPDAQQGAALEPLVAPGSVVILDRHYTSFAPYRSRQPNLYAVRCAGALQLRFAALEDGVLILRPNSITFPVQLVPIQPGQSPSDLIVGRVCLVLNEL